MSVEHLIAQYGYIMIFGLLMLGIVGPLIPDETILVFAGILVHKGQLQFVPVVAVAYAGSVCGITLSYTLGRTGVLLLMHKFRPLRSFGAKHLAQVHDWFERFGRWTLFFGYFVAGVRHVTAVVAGTSKLSVPVFALYAYTGGLVWVVCFVSIGYFVGDEWSRVSRQVDRGVLIAAVAIAGAIGLWFHIRRKRKSRNG
ncbi:MAG: DedA family protein [Acidobacteriota bacterium]|nr:DedA family protein [Acidobacteriota bacterium]